MARARSLAEFQQAFPDEARCAAFLFERRWPNGFVCPACGGRRAVALKCLAHTYRLLASDLEHLMATHSNGMSARQLEDQLGVTYKTA
jgi:hypothetical protein